MPGGSAGLREGCAPRWTPTAPRRRAEDVASGVGLSPWQRLLRSGASATPLSATRTPLACTVRARLSTVSPPSGGKGATVPVDSATHANAQAAGHRPDPPAAMALVTWAHGACHLHRAPRATHSCTARQVLGSGPGDLRPPTRRLPPHASGWAAHVAGHAPSRAGAPETHLPRTLEERPTLFS